jgi:hypothetical protein
MLDITGQSVVLSNLYFPASTAVPVARVRTAAADTNILTCYFECGTNDVGSAVGIITGASAIYIDDTVFISTAGSPAAQPTIGINVINAVTGLIMDNVIFDGGVSGWSSSALLGTAAITNLRATNIDLMNDSVASFASGSNGKFYLRNKSGNSEVIWTP